LLLLLLDLTAVKTEIEASSARQNRNKLYTWLL